MSDRQRPDLLLTVLPFGDIQAPAIGVGLLAAEAREAGFTVEVMYPAFDLAETVGRDLYLALAGYGDHSSVADAPPTENLIGEWFFAEAAFGDRAPAADPYIARFLANDPHLAPLVPRILEARGQLGAQVERWGRAILDRRPRVVGFTTTFYQTCACLAVSRRLAAAPDPPIIVLGGANCGGAMGLQLLRSFRWIDYVCTGEGDEALPRLLRRLLAEGRPGSLPGLVRQGETETAEPAPLVRDMDALPYPDYSAYFRRLERSPLRRAIEPHLLVETARGCWWGEKHHCTFCGLNAEAMAFRAKSPERALDEILHLARAYGVEEIDCVDNILHMPYLNSLLPELARREERVRLFFETKANLKHAHLRTLREAGVWGIQPGIESFSDQVLELMRKGTRGLQNLQVLRWCEELGLEVIWNILYGFPGEPPEAYRRMAELVPLITHLRRPTFLVRIRLDRFSPFFSAPEAFGMTDVRPARAYAHVYPLDEATLMELAYFFEFEYAEPRDPESYTGPLREAVNAWAAAAARPPEERPRLDLHAVSQEVCIVRDTRECAVRPLHLLTDAARELYLACDVARPADWLASRLAPDVSETEVRAILGDLVENRLMVESADRYLSLAVFRARQPSARPRARTERERRRQLYSPDAGRSPTPALDSGPSPALDRSGPAD